MITDLGSDGGRGRADVIADLRVDAVGGASVNAELSFGVSLKYQKAYTI